MLRIWAARRALAPLILLSLLSRAAFADSGFYPTRFEDFVQKWTQNSGNSGTAVPFPFDQLESSLLSLDERSSILQTLIPHGRSLERTFTDYDNPRAVMAWQSASTSSPFLLFVAYTPEKEELEVISWNWQDRHFDFRLVQDYAAGKSPRVVEANRALCVACHQNESVVFPQSPWSETSDFNPVLNELSRNRHLPDFARIMLKNRYSGGRIKTTTEELDTRVRSADDMLQSQQMCAGVCGDNLDCRRQMLLAGLTKGAGDYLQNVFDQARLDRFNSSLSSNWPDEDFSQINNIIVNRLVDDANPLDFTPDEDPLLPRERTRFVLQDSAAASIDSVAIYQSCFNFKPDQMAMLKAYGTKTLAALVEKPQITAVLARWLPDESEVMDALQAAVSGQPYVLPPSSPAAGAPAVLELTSHPRFTPAELFTHFCKDCHGGDTPQAPRLELENLSALKSYIGSAGRSVQVLIAPDQKIMPPRLAPQPSDEDRSRMLDALLSAP
jgi:hypothetical protein